MNFNNELNSELPVNHLSAYPNIPSNSNSFPNNASVHSNRGISNRFYTLANLSPPSSTHTSGDENSGQPHNRQNIPSVSKPRLIRNNYHNNYRTLLTNHTPTQFQQNQHNNSDIDENRINSQEVLDFTASSGSPRMDNIEPHYEYNNDNNHHSINHIRPSPEMFNSYSLRSTRTNNNELMNLTNQNTVAPGGNVSIKHEEEYKINAFGSKYTCPMLDQESHSPQTVHSEDLPYNWQASKSTVIERISSMYNNHTMADIYFIIGKPPNCKRIPSHQFVLAISSAVFDAMFFGPLAAKKQKKNINSEDVSKSSDYSNNCIDDKHQDPSSIIEIPVPDVEPVAFMALLKFIYTDEVHIGPDTVMTTLYAAKKYSIPALEKACVDYLRRNLCSENAFMLLTQARLFNEVQLAHQCLDFIDKNTSDSLAADGFLDIDLETLCSVLDRDTLGIREIKLFQAVIRWSEAQYRKREQQCSLSNSDETVTAIECSTIKMDGSNSNSLNESCPTNQIVHNQSEIPPEEIRAILGPALKLIRFPLMNVDDFANGVAQTRILGNPEVVDIFLYFLSNPKPSIPYKNVPRCCLTGKEQVINRYPVVEQRWGYSGTSDRIRFMVDRKIFIVGFGLYGSAQGPAEYQVVIEILQQESGNVLASNYLTLKCDGSNSTFRVRFKEPVEILQNVSYIACATLKGPDSYYGSIGYQKVIHKSSLNEKVTFQFNYAAGNNNGTSVEDGQIPEIIFYM